MAEAARIYLDHAATTPLHPEVAAAMAVWMGGVPANPSSLHQEGRRARRALDEAREVAARAMGCLFGEAIFTSSGTEALNLAILGQALANQDPRRRRVLFGAADHHAVLNVEPLLRRLGYAVELVRVDRQSRLDLGHLASLLDDDVLLLAAIHANNETGAIQPVREAAGLAHAHGTHVLVDAVQTFPVRPDDLGADLLAASAHKFHGPPGAGLLYVRAGVRLDAVARGGGQERDLRAGTENLAAIVGMAEAIRRLPEWPDRRAQARDAFLHALTEAARTIEPSTPCLPGHAHVRFPGVGAESLLIRLDRMGVAASAGAACSSGSIEPSHVMRACGYSAEEASEGLRFSFGRFATVNEAAEAARRVAAAVQAVRLGAPG